MKPYTWNAQDYAHSSSAQQQWAQELIHKLQLQPHDQVLDVGCGDGKVTAEIARLVPHGNAVGIDYAATMVDLAQATHREMTNLQFQQLDARQLYQNQPFHQQFTVAFSNAVLHWITDHPAVLQGIAQSLKPSGRLLLQMGGKGNASAMIHTVTEITHSPQWANYFTDFKFPYSFYSPTDYEQWLPAAGLIPVRLELIPKDMTHNSANELAGWLRTTWHPYTAQVPTEQREELIWEIVTRYLEHHPADDQGRTHVQMVRLEVAATKSPSPQQNHG